MRSKSVARVLFLLTVVVVAIPAGSIGTHFQIDPVPMPDLNPGYGSPNTPGGSCTYCAMFKCGCAPAPPGEILSAMCNCSGTNCWNSCAYIPIGE